MNQEDTYRKNLIQALNELKKLDQSIPSLKELSQKDQWMKFKTVYELNSIIAMKWLFYLRDIKQGHGEQNLFRSLFDSLVISSNGIAISYIYEIPNFGRWDDIIWLYKRPYKKEVHEYILRMIVSQLSSDLCYARKRISNKVSFLAKWMPSINTSSKETVSLAKQLMKDFHMNQESYRKMLSYLRKHLNIVEQKMSNNQWDQIDYHLISKDAEKQYANAFLKHDKERRLNYMATKKPVKNQKKDLSDILYSNRYVSITWL